MSAGNPIGRAIGAAAPLWLRGPARLENGSVVLDAANGELFQPQAEPGLLFDLAGIRRPTDTLAFVKRYGLLRHGPEADFHSEPFREWEGVALVLTGLMGLYEDVRRAAQGDVEPLRAREAALMDMVRSDEVLTEVVESLHGGTADERLIETATLLVCVGITSGLEGVKEGVSPGSMWGEGPPGSLIFTPHPTDLVGLAYHELAMLTVNQALMLRCPECGRFFARRDKRQRFCSDLCAGRSRQRRYAEKKSGRG